MDTDSLVRNKHKRKLLVSSDDELIKKVKDESELKQEHLPNIKPPSKVQSRPEQPKTISRPKNNIVYDILKRWWYCMEEWPPVDYDYEAQLTILGYRSVLVERFSREEELDSNGKAKVYPVPGYLGLFRNSQGQSVDARPQHLSPSFENLKQKSLRELFDLLIKAYQCQIREYSSLEQEEQDPAYLGYLQNQMKKTGNQQRSLLEKIQSIKKINDSQL